LRIDAWYPPGHIALVKTASFFEYAVPAASASRAFRRAGGAWLEAHVADVVAER